MRCMRVDVALDPELFNYIRFTDDQGRPSSRPTPENETWMKWMRDEARPWEYDGGNARFGNGPIRIVLYIRDDSRWDEAVELAKSRPDYFQAWSEDAKQAEAHLVYEARMAEFDRRAKERAARMLAQTPEACKIKLFYGEEGALYDISHRDIMDVLDAIRTRKGFGPLTWEHYVHSLVIGGEVEDCDEGPDASVGFCNRWFRLSAELADHAEKWTREGKKMTDDVIVAM